MGSRRTIILIGAVLFGLLAAIGLFSYVQGVEDSAAEGSEIREVYVVKEAIPQGTPAAEALGNELIKKESAQAEFIPPTAITDTSQINGLLAAYDVPVGSIVVDRTFVNEREASTGLVSLLKQDDMVTVTLDLKKDENVAGFVQPGDFVNVLSVNTPTTPFWGTGETPGVTDLSQEAYNEMIAVIAANRMHSYIPEDLSASLRLGEDEDPKKFSELTKEEKAAVIDWVTSNEIIQLSNQLSLRSARYLYQKAQVVAVDSKLAPRLGEQAAETAEGQVPTNLLVTLAVKPRDVQVILNASTTGGGIYLSLVPDNYEPTPLPQLDRTLQVAPGEDEYRLEVGGTGRILEDVDGRIPTDAKQVGGSASEAEDEEPAEETPAPTPVPATGDAPAEDGAPGDLAFQSPPPAEATN